MRVLLVHPSPLMYSEVYLRLEPLGLERVAAAVLEAGHDVRMIDLQLFTHRDYFRELEELQTAGGRLFAQLPGQRSRSVGSRQGYQASCKRLLYLRGRPQRVVCRPDILNHAARHD